MYMMRLNHLFCAPDVKNGNTRFHAHRQPLASEIDCPGRIFKTYGETVMSQVALQDGDAAVNAGMERLIRPAPGQYLWSYARYKQPTGEE
jgi:lauroyl/myristoyl acyltransferase